METSVTQNLKNLLSEEKRAIIGLVIIFLGTLGIGISRSLSKTNVPHEWEILFVLYVTILTVPFVIGSRQMKFKEKLLMTGAYYMVFIFMVRVGFMMKYMHHDEISIIGYIRDMGMLGIALIALTIAGHLTTNSK